MIKVSWEEFNKKEFLDALMKLKKVPDEKLTATTRFRVATIAQACFLQMIEAQKATKDLLEKYAKKDEKGEILGFPDQSKIEFPSKADEEKYDAAFKVMLATRFKINCSPILVSSLEGASLSGVELLALNPVLIDI